MFVPQADVCHAYQILKRGGLKDENIVVFMFDDIATSEMNPRPGVIINHPQGDDVYSGVPKVQTSYIPPYKLKEQVITIHQLKWYKLL